MTHGKKPPSARTRRADSARGGERERMSADIGGSSSVKGSASLAVPLGPERLTATEALRLISSGQLQAETLAKACLNRIEQRDPDVRAWTHVDSDHVLHQARTRDAHKVRGPLHGIPVGVKDTLFTQDMPTSYNSPHFQDFFPKIDAASVAVLRAAGTVILGKNDTVEFAVNGRRAATRNPHDLRHTPGGSSSGSAAAVADFQVPLSLGTQTGGSVIRPASYCGVYAMKPTWNAVPHEGSKVCAASMDTLGWYARSVDDLELLCDVFELCDDEPTRLDSLNCARIAVCRSPVWDQALPATRNALKQCVDVLRAAGAEVAELELDEPFGQLTEAHKTIMQSEMRSAFLAEKVLLGDALYPELKQILRNDRGLTRAAQREAYDLAAQCRVRFDRLAAPFTAVLTPSTPGEAPRGLDDTGVATFNRIWTLLHTPCINLPGFVGPNELPVGLTLTGPRFSDRRLVAVARLMADLMPRQGATEGSS